MSNRFSHTIKAEQLLKGLRPFKRIPKDTGYAVECEGAVGRNGVLQILDELERMDTGDITDGFPFPQIFVFTNMIIVCGYTKIYEWVAGALNLKLTVTGGTTWSAADFYEYIYMSNGKVAVTRDALSREYSVTTQLPTASSICNYNGQVMIGAPDVPLDLERTHCWKPQEIISASPLISFGSISGGLSVSTPPPPSSPVGRVYYFMKGTGWSGINRLEADTQTGFTALLATDDVPGNRAAVNSSGMSYWPISSSANRGIVIFYLPTMTRIGKITTTDRPMAVIVDEANSLLYYLAFHNATPLKIWKVDLNTGLEISFVQSSASENQGDISSFARSGNYIYATSILSLHKYQIFPTFLYVGRIGGTIYEGACIANATPSDKLYTTGGTPSTQYLRRYNLGTFTLEASVAASVVAGFPTGIAYDNAQNYAYGANYGNPCWLYKWKSDASTFSKIQLNTGSEYATNGSVVINSLLSKIYIGTTAVAATNLVYVDMAGMTIDNKVNCIGLGGATSLNVGLYYQY